MIGYSRSKRVVYLLNYHFVFVPKYRWKLLRGAIRERLLVLINEYAARYNVTILAVEGCRITFIFSSVRVLAWLPAR